MKRMVLSVALVTLLLPGLALADKEGGDRGKGSNAEANFEKAKARKIDDLKAKLACVEAATTPEAMKACREQVSKRREMEDKKMKLQKIQEHKRRLEEQERKIQGVPAAPAGAPPAGNPPAGK
ncbi:MAG: hypothetical protein HQM06_06320 [Magnetococcales bacterium]|nr:hypothetical protein [Magnetococcales bacterium]